MAYVAGPFSDPHLLMQWGGTLPGLEQWSCSMRFKSVSGTILTPNDQDAMLPGVVTALKAYHARPASLIASGALLSYVKLNTIGTDGHYEIDTTSESIFADTAGGNSAAAPANQIALVVSLETGFSRGPAHEGRYYSPLCPALPGADGLIVAADATSCHGSVTTLLAALNAVNSNFKLAIFSRKSGAPASRLVTGARVGRVLDTQRRRRRSLAESYV
jgi:hypothetical protein